eukprot:5554660-Pleurochrysis_carterae.AAC.2
MVRLELVPSSSASGLPFVVSCFIATSCCGGEGAAYSSSFVSMLSSTIANGQVPPVAHCTAPTALRVALTVSTLAPDLGKTFR